MKKINIAMILILLLSLAATGLVAYELIEANKKVTVPDFLGKDAGEAVQWCGQLDSRYGCEFVYEESTTIEKDKIFQQSVSAGSKLEDKITFNVSSGLIVQVEVMSVTDTTTKNDVQNWAAANNLSKVTYIEETNDKIEAGKVIRIEPSGTIRPDAMVTVYVSKGPAQEAETNADGDIVIKSGSYTGLSVSEFETKVKALGLVPNHLSSRDASSSTVAKGDIVWHGSGTYEKGEKINYGVCTEKTEGIVVKSGTYVGKSEADFRKAAEDLGLKANHNSEKDDYSDTVAKGYIVWHGSGTYEKNETFNYGLSLGKKDGTAIDDLYVTKNQYTGKSEAEFIATAKAMGLNPVHLSSRDDYSDTIAKGSIVTHGYGQYVNGEDFNYGLSLGKKDSSASDDLYVTQDKYVGKSESEFISIANSLGLKPTHISSRDAYSDTVAKGNIVTHGYGQYEKGEEFKYGLSLGKKSDSSASDTVTVSGGMVGKSESEFTTYIKGLGLNPVKDGSNYSDTYAANTILSYTSGEYTKGSTVYYTLSLGKKASQATIMRPEYYQASDSYEGTKATVQKALSSFPNLSFVEATSTGVGVGQILKITVNGDESYAGGSYSTDVTIVVYIVARMAS